MAGSKMGSLKKKMGLKGKMKPGQMISKMNEMKNKGISGKVAYKKGKKEMPKKSVEKKVMKKMPKKAMKIAKKETKTKPQGKGIVKALGQKGTTGNFKKIENAKGKGAAIGALQNKLAARKGEKAPFPGKKK